MGRRRSKHERPGPLGFLVVDKPAGMTSHDVVDLARRALGIRRIGHLGTLDPQATGVLPLAVREATKLVSYLEKSDKSYVGVVHLGIETDTLDGDGEVVRRHDGELPTRAQVLAALDAFRGDIEQVPPMYSAVKRDGVPLHRLARRGEEVEREPKKVRIDRLELLSFDPPELRLRVDCSAGTYVRTLAFDLGRALGCGAHLSGLRRERSGPFDSSMAVAADVIEREGPDAEARLLDPVDVLGLPVLPLSPESERRIRHGADISPGSALRLAPGDRVLAASEDRETLALLQLRADRRLWPLRVLRGAD